MTILPNHTGQSARPGGNSDHPVVVEEGPSCSKWNAGAPYRLEPMSYTFINIIIVHARWMRNMKCLEYVHSLSFFLFLLLVWVHGLHSNHHGIFL